MKSIFIFSLTILTFNACTHTIEAWDNHPVREYVEVLGDNTLPQIIEKQGIPYTCTELTYSSAGYTHKCYVEKSLAEKVDDWQIRLYESSRGFLTDTGKNVLIAGQLFIMMAAQSGVRYP
ncbi:MAG TPA: hypothetical protein ENK86_04250 [Campylobacterales bacterium]|nr:hypothetical protein [Campylobacterales bacterium]